MECTSSFFTTPNNQHDENNEIKSAHDYSAKEKHKKEEEEAQLWICYEIKNTYRRREMSYERRK